MQAIIDLITEKSVLLINESLYRPIGKAFYVTVSKPNQRYVKVFLEGHFELVISPSDNIVNFGQDVGNLGNELPNKPTFQYKGKSYERIATDYEIVVSLVFGNPIEIEGETTFWDYQAIDDSKLIISLGLVQRTQKRRDIVARIINIHDIEVR